MRFLDSARLSEGGGEHRVADARGRAFDGLARGSEGLLPAAEHGARERATSEPVVGERIARRQAQRGVDVPEGLLGLLPEDLRDAEPRPGTGAVRIQLEGARPGADRVLGPATDVVLVCGVFGNVCDDDIRGTVRAPPTLCVPGATVIWTRHRHPPDLTVDIRRWFGEAGYEEIGFVGSEEQFFGVGAHRLTVRHATGRRTS